MGLLNDDFEFWSKAARRWRFWRAWSCAFVLIAAAFAWQAVRSSVWIVHLLAPVQIGVMGLHAWLATRADPSPSGRSARARVPSP